MLARGLWGLVTGEQEVLGSQWCLQEWKCVGGQQAQAVCQM